MRFGLKGALVNWSTRNSSSERCNEIFWSNLHWKYLACRLPIFPIDHLHKFHHSLHPASEQMERKPSHGRTSLFGACYLLAECGGRWDMFHGLQCVPGFLKMVFGSFSLCILPFLNILLFAPVLNGPHI